MNKEIYVFLLMMCKDKYTAEDIMQETFIAVYENAGRFKVFDNPKAWIYTIAKNKMLNTLKKNSRAASLDALEDSIEDTTQTENAVLDKIRAEALLSVLSEQDKKIVILHAVYGLKHREIAELTGLPLGTVTRRYKESIEKMRKKNMAEKNNGELFFKSNNQNEVII